VEITLDKLWHSKSDQELWTGIRNSDETAFTLVFELYHATLYNYGIKLCSNTAIVEDAVQDVFIDIWRLRNGLTPDIISIKFYLYRALRRRIHSGRDKFPPTEEISLLDDAHIPFSHADSETLLIETESTVSRSKYIKWLLSKLPGRQIEALTLRYFDDFAAAEIAQIMGVSEKSVRNFIYKALTTLRADH
jgi:RNA polymerase sigma factor (sigma-70 family)